MLIETKKKHLVEWNGYHEIVIKQHIHYMSQISSVPDVKRLRKKK